MGGYEVLAPALSTSNIGQLYKITEHDIMRNMLARTNQNIVYLLLKVMNYNLCNDSNITYFWRTFENGSGASAVS
jgi:hypothetical protein